VPTFEDFSSEQLLEDVITAALEYEGDFKSKFLELLEEAAENPVMLDLLRDIADGVYIEYTPGIEEELAKIDITIDQLGEILNEAMTSVGQKTIDSIGFDIQFDMTSPEAIDYAGRMSARLVTNVGQAIKDSIRDVVQEVLRNDMTLSQMRRFVKQRVGLLPSHSRAVTNLYNNLISTSGPQTAAKRANEYANRLRNYRADMITRTEIATAQSYGQLATWQQFLRDRVIPPDSVRIWMTAQDERVCEFCGPMHLATAPVDGEWVVPLQSGGMGSVSVPTDIHPNCRCASGLTFPVGRMNEFLSKHGVSGFEIWNLKKHYKGTKFDHDQGSHAGTRRKERNVANATATGFAPVWKAFLEHADAVKFINEKYGGKFDIPDMDDVYSVKFRGDPSAGELAKEALAEEIGKAILEQMTPEELQEAYQQFALLTKDIGAFGTVQLDEIVSPHYTSHLDILEFLGPDKTWSLGRYGVESLGPDQTAALINLMEEAGIKPGGLTSNPGAHQNSVVVVWPEDLSGNIQLLDPITMDELANVPALPRSSDSFIDESYRVVAYFGLLSQANRLTVKQTVDAFRSNPELLQAFNDAGFRIGRTMHETNTVTVDINRSRPAHTLEPGIHKAIGSGIVNAWAISSQSIGSRLLGRAVISEFGASNKLDPDDTTERAINNRQASGETDSLEKLFRIAAVRQYEMTQRALKAAGITHVDLVRGMSISQPVKGVRESEMRALSSWSTEMKTTRSFAGWLGDGQPTYVSARFPIERIFATPLTGIGCFHEAEFVVLGVPGTDNVFFIPEREIEELKYYGSMDGREKVIFKEMEFPEATVLGTVTKAIVKPIWIDEDIINADWIKVAGVDLPGVETAEDYIEYYGLDTDEALAAHINEVKSLPYWVGVPSEIKDGLASVRLSKHLDGQHDQKKHGKWAKSYTGHPALDDVIASFLDSSLSWDEQCKIGNTSAADIAGYCAVIADEFTAYAKERLPEGWRVYTTHTNIEEMGYTPSGDPSGYVLDENGNEVLGFYFEHAVNSVYPPGANFPIEIDFTAKQYGYDAPVLVHKSIKKHAEHNQDDHGNWARGVVSGWTRGQRSAAKIAVIKEWNRLVAVAKKNGEYIGFMYGSLKSEVYQDSTIETAYVVGKYRRQGVAADMREALVAAAGDEFSGTPSNMSRDGAAFMSAVSGKQYKPTDDVQSGEFGYLLESYGEKASELLSKHAEHNQDDHGNWARGGNRYPYDKQFIRDSSFVASQFGSDLPTSKDVMEAMFSGDDPVTSEELDAAVHQLSFELAYAGEPYVNFSFDYWSADSEQDIAQAVVEAVNQDWAGDVSDPGPIFYSQLAAETISELTGIKFDTRHLTEEQVKVYSDIVNNPEKAKAVSFFRKVAIAQYKLTQQMFERSGITHLQVWRGVSAKKDSPFLSNQSDGKPFLQAEIEDRALSSWSTNYSIAKRFGWINSPSYKQLIMHQIVPVEFVFSMAGQRGGTTTLGAALEDEVVLFGGFGEVNVFVDWKTYDETRVRDILTGKKVFEKVPSKVVSGSGDPLMHWGLVDKANKLKRQKVDLTDDKNANWIKSLAERDQ